MLTRIEQIELQLKNCQLVIDGCPQQSKEACINQLSYPMEQLRKELSELKKGKNESI